MEELQVQLDQMKFALHMADAEDKAGLEIIIKDLENLIKDYQTVSENQSPPGIVKVEEDEYSKFQAEIAALEPDYSEQASSSTSNNDKEDTCISDEIAALEGLRCLAPHQEAWGQIGFYPAMISQVIPNSSTENNSNENGNILNAMESIMVRVAFLQPVVKSQLLCPFFKDDRCRFSDDDCRYSHGEIVPLTSLREAIEPDYSKVVPSAHVLAKYSDGLWYNAIVTKLTNDGNCEVRFDKSPQEVVELGIHDTNPILDFHDSSSDDSDDDAPLDEDDDENSSSAALCLRSNEILHMTGTESLGDWEKYTKGFGSKLMMKMGYVMGSGIGRKSDGRVNPVDAVIVPPGMSLDKWMNIKEKAGGNYDKLTVEKRLKKAQRIHSVKEKQSSKHKKLESVFDFINTKLILGKGTSRRENSIKLPENMNKQSSSHLNKKMLHLGESMRKVSKDIVKVRQSMKRIEGRGDSSTLTLMQEKLKHLEKQKADLSKVESTVIQEQKHRSDKKKLTEF